MTNAELGSLYHLLDKIKLAIDSGSLDYHKVKENMKKILAGDEIHASVHHEIQNALSFLGSLDVQETQETQIKLVPGKYHRTEIEGLESVKSGVGPFFTKYPSPFTESGKGAIFTTSKPLSIMEMALELIDPADEKESVEKYLIESGISFSFQQVINILSEGIIGEIIKYEPTRSIIFFVHDSKKTEIGTLIMSYSKHTLYGKNLEDTYNYREGVIVVSRRIPKHLEEKQSLG